MNYYVDRNIFRAVSILDFFVVFLFFTNTLLPKPVFVYVLLWPLFIILYIAHPTIIVYYQSSFMIFVL